MKLLVVLFTRERISVEKTDTKGACLCASRLGTARDFSRGPECFIFPEKICLWLPSFSSWIPERAARCCEISQRQGRLEEAENMLTVLLSDAAEKGVRHLNSIVIIQ